MNSRFPAALLLALWAAPAVRAQTTSSGDDQRTADVRAAALGIAHISVNAAVDAANRGAKTASQTAQAIFFLRAELLKGLQARRETGETPSSDPALIRRILKLQMSINNGRLQIGTRFKRYPTEAEFDKHATLTKAAVDRYVATCRRDVDISRSKYVGDKIAALENAGLAHLIASLPVDPALERAPEPRLDPEDEALRDGFPPPQAAPLPFPGR